MTLLETLGIDHLFEIICGGDTFPEMKPSPLPLLQAMEILGIAAGLWLSLGTTAAELGGTVLLSVCVVSLLVRMQHYSAVRR